MPAPLGLNEAISSMTGQEPWLERLRHLLADLLGEGLLRQVAGVGPITSLAFVLTLEAPERFRKSRTVGPYLAWSPDENNREIPIPKGASPNMETGA
jgi:hypothetical protein